MSTSAFYSCDVTERKTSMSSVCVKKTEEEIGQFYEIERCANWIKDGDYKRVALQFPDELLVDSIAVVQRLEDAVTAKIFVLGDTSYGSCCVDEIAAQHYEADCIIHFGSSCLSPTKRLPVLYVFGQAPISIDDCISKFKQLFPDKESKVIVMYDTCYLYAVDAVFEQITSCYSKALLCKLNIPDSNASQCSDVRLPVAANMSLTNETKPGSCTVCKCSRLLTLLGDDTLDMFSVFYIGPESVVLTNLMMNWTKCIFYTYDPITFIGRQETLNVNKALMKRFYMIERAKDANIVGIVVGTLGVEDYLEVINRLKYVIKNAGKKSYTFVVGKLNVAKLANFMEIDVFVLVSCPENTLIDSSEFYKPVVTPFEMEFACNKARVWTGDYSTDFHELLPGAPGYIDLPLTETGKDDVDISLISNKIRTFGKHDDVTSSDGSMAVVPRNESMAVTTVNAESAGEYLSARSWRGLEQNLGATPVKKAVKGQCGIAASYDSETCEQ